MMFYRRRASPKHYYSIIKVVYGGGGHRTRLKIPNDQLLCLLGCPLAPVYKGARGGGGRPGRGVPRGSPTPTGSRIPLFLVQLGVLPSSRSRRQGRGRGKRRKEGAAPLPLVQFGLVIGGGVACLSLSPLKPNKAHILLPPYSCNSPVLRKIPESLGTFLKSEYSRPIYQSLHLDHFETPRHVPDLIRDHITHNTNCHRTLNVRTLRFRELCRHDRDTSPVNNQ